MVRRAVAKSNMAAPALRRREMTSAASRVVVERPVKGKPPALALDEELRSLEASPGISDNSGLSRVHESECALGHMTGRGWHLDFAMDALRARQEGLRREDEDIGRVARIHCIEHRNEWQWSVYGAHPTGPGVTHGAETDPQEARRKVEAVWAYAKANGTSREPLPRGIWRWRNGRRGCLSQGKVTPLFRLPQTRCQLLLTCLEASNGH
jgi:hypothetical protein